LSAWLKGKMDIARAGFRQKASDAGTWRSQVATQAV